MKRWSLIAFVFCLGLNLFPAPGVRAETVTIAYLQEGLNELQKTEKQVALKLWADELIQKGDFDVEIIPVATMSRLGELIKGKSISYAIINTVYYLDHHDDLKDYFDKTFWAIKRSESLYEEYVILTRKQQNINQFSQLSGKRFSVAKGSLLMNFYMNYLVLKAGHPSPVHFFKKVKDTNTASQAVLDVYFGKSDACIVPQHILDMAVELNPSIMDRLKIIHRSGPSFIPVLIVGTTYNPASVNAVFSDSIQRIHDTPRGEQIINLFKIHSAVMIGPEQLAAMIAIYSDYQRLAALGR